MPHFEKRNGRWRARMMRDGKVRTATFDTKAQAQAWASDVLSDEPGKTSGTFDQALSKYAREVTPKKRGASWEATRIAKFRRELPFLHKPMHAITAAELSAWRDERSKEVSAATVLREMGILGAVWQAARIDWRWVDSNPVREIRKPAQTKPRSRVISEAEADELILALGYTGGTPKGTSQRVAVAFMLALETAMRAGEIASIRKGDIRGTYVRLDQTKNGDSRDVPLTKAARELFDLCPDGLGVSAQLIDALFRRARAKAEKRMPSVATIHFHDARRTAASRMAQKLGPMELAKVTGHRDLKVLLNTYYSVTPESLAAKLDS